MQKVPPRGQPRHCGHVSRIRLLSSVERRRGYRRVDRRDLAQQTGVLVEAERRELRLLCREEASAVVEAAHLNWRLVEGEAEAGEGRRSRRGAEGLLDLMKEGAAVVEEVQSRPGTHLRLYSETHEVEGEGGRLMEPCCLVEAEVEEDQLPKVCFLLAAVEDQREFYYR